MHKAPSTKVLTELICQNEVNIPQILQQSDASRQNIKNPLRRMTYSLALTCMEKRQKDDGIQNRYIKQGNSGTYLPLQSLIKFLFIIRSNIFGI